jgi:hypothetical protein
MASSRGLLVLVACVIVSRGLATLAAEAMGSAGFLQKRNLSSGAKVSDFFLITDRILYKVANTMPLEWSDGWDRNSNRAMAADGQGGVFVMATGHLYHVTEDNKDGGDPWSSGWSVDAMVSDGMQGIFVFSRGHLYHVTQDKKDGGERLSSDWYPVAITSDGENGAYVISRKTLYHIDPTGAWVKYSDHEWSSDDGYSSRPVMARDGKDGLFIKDAHFVAAQGNRPELWHVSPANKDGTQLWSGDAENNVGNTALATDGQGGVYMVDRMSELSHVSSDGSVEKWSDKYTLASSFCWAEQTLMLPDGSGGVIFFTTEGRLLHYTDAHKAGMAIADFSYDTLGACMTAA